MNITKGFLLLFWTTASSSQDGGSKTRFDKILQDFGFSGIGATQKQNAPQLLDEAKQSEREGRNRAIDIQSNSIPDARSKPRPSKKVKSSDALAALFSVAGRPKESKKPVTSIQTKKSRPNPATKLPIAKVLNERIENPVFSSNTPARRLPNNKGLIENERNNRRNQGSRVESPRSRSQPQNAARKPLPVANANKPKLTSGGIPIVSKISTKTRPNQNKVPSRSSNIIKPSARSKPPQSVPRISSPVPANAIPGKNSRPVVDPVARLVSIANNKASNQPVVGQTTAKKLNLAGKTPSQQQTQKKTFNFDDTLKEFGFSPRLVSGTNFKKENNPVQAPQRPRKNNARKPLPVPQVSVKPLIQQKSLPRKEIPTISSKPNPTSGLNSLIALAGDPKSNPVIKTSAPPISPIKPIPRRTDALRQGQTFNTRVPPNNSALGNLQSIADGKGPTFTVRNRARGPSRKPVNPLPNNRKNPSKVDLKPSKLLQTQEKSVFEINPFVNVNLQKKQEESPRSQNVKDLVFSQR